MNIREAQRSGGRIVIAIVILVACLLITVCHRAEAAMPPCAPYVPFTEQQLATGGDWQVEQARYGWHFYWPCEDAVGKVTWHGFVCSYAGNECNTLKFATFVKDLFAGGDQKAKVATAWAAEVSAYDCNDAASQARTDWVGDICREDVWLFEYNKAKWTANIKPAVWKVKPNGALTTRPAKAFVKGVLGSKEVARAPVGSACDVGKPYLVNGKDVWAAYDASGHVALCGRVQ